MDPFLWSPWKIRSKFAIIAILMGEQFYWFLNFGIQILPMAKKSDPLGLET